MPDPAHPARPPRRNTGARPTKSSAPAPGYRFDPASAPSCETIEALAEASNIPFDYTGDALDAMRRSRDALLAVHRRGEPIYGLTTGFGPFVTFDADRSAHEQGSGLIAHLGAGFGPLAPRPAARAALILRCQTLARGFSGVDPDAARALADLLTHDLTPAIPALGSVGASGDLIPLAHAARVITGEGWILSSTGDRAPAAGALGAAGLSPMPLTGRDALSIVNGTAFMTAYAALALARADRLLARAESLTGYLYRLLGCRAAALDDRLHAVRGHHGQTRSSRAIRAEAERYGTYEDASRPLQEVYSLRCAPQILGACRENLTFARRLIESEIAGVSDNPVVWPGSDGQPPAVIHGGNFQGQQIAFAADALGSALTQAALLAERQLDVLANPDLTNGAPLLLAPRPGATSGLAGVQITATALVAEMRHHQGAAANSSIPTNGRNQDVVSMGTMAARLAFDQTERLAGVLAAATIGALQLSALRAAGVAPGAPARPPEWFPDFEPLLTRDRALHDDLALGARALLRADDPLAASAARSLKSAAPCPPKQEPTAAPVPARSSKREPAPAATSARRRRAA